DPNAHVTVAAGIPLPTAIVAVDGAAVEGKAAKTAVEASVVKRAAVMEGERTRPAVPSHRESTATESATAESATHGVPAHPSMRGHTTVSATTPRIPPPPRPPPSSPHPAVPPPTTRRRNGRGKGARCSDWGGGGNSHESLCKHDSASLVLSPPKQC